MFRKERKETNQKIKHVGGEFKTRKHIVLGGAHFWTKNDERLFGHESKGYICIIATCTGIIVSRGSPLPLPSPEALNVKSTRIHIPPNTMVTNCIWIRMKS